MCGIAGFAGAGSPADLAAMSAALYHRGPDGRGVHFEARESVALGHQRLVVIDPAGGTQPMWNEDASVAVLFNGEIYNARDLRRDLEARGHRFASDHADTEVLVHGYEEWGADLPQRLNGMFAFAVYDRRAGRLFLARDRFGEKPLYYTVRTGLFAFASELSGLLQHRDIDFTLNGRAIQKLFAYGYIPAPHTAVDGVLKLPAGWLLEYDLRSGAANARAWWEFHVEPDDALRNAREDVLVEQLRALLSDAVRRRLASDVPLGIFLSGGLDSATVLAFAGHDVPYRELSTFTVGFNEASFDESRAASNLAQAFGTRHRSTCLDLESAASLIPDVLGRLDEPLGDPSLLPTFLLCRFARESVTVALSGDGGDELFAGYDPFLALGPANVYHRFVPRSAHELMRGIVARLPHGTGYMTWDFRLRRALAGLSYSPRLWNPVWMGPVEPRAMAELFEEPLSSEELYEEAIAIWESAKAPDLCSRTSEFFTRLYLQNDILTKVDRASMMVSLESRAVFLDPDLADFCRRLPNEWKLRGGTRKYLLRKALRGLVPDQVLRRRKQGFGVPVASWLRQLPWLESSVSVPGLKVGAVRDAWRRHASGETDERQMLWTWVALQGWLSHSRRREPAQVACV